MHQKNRHQTSTTPNHHFLWATLAVQPSINPVNMAHPHSMLPQPAVILTKPARMPLHKPPTSYFLVMKYRKMKTVRPPVAAARVVFMATCAASAPSLPPFMVKVLPGLKPYQPNHSAKVPNLRQLGLENSSRFSQVQQEKPNFEVEQKIQKLQTWCPDSAKLSKINPKSWKPNSKPPNKRPK